MATAPLERGVPLESNVRTDVAVVGAGITGLTTAYLLARSGRNVAVIEDGPIGGGETSRTSGHLCSALDERYYMLEKMHGAQAARIAAQSHASAIHQIERIIADEQIDCDFARVDGYLFVPPHESPQQLRTEEAAARRAGLEVEWVERLPVASYDFGPALRFANQGRFHVVRYLHGLTRALARLGVQVHDARVEGIRQGRLDTSTGAKVEARDVVVATHSPVNDRVLVHTKQAAYRSYVLALPLQPDAMPDILMWDTPDPYHYARRWRDWLIVGGEDHKTGQADDFAAPFARLEQWARERFRIAGGEVLRWSGQIMEPIDGLAFIGHNPVRGDHTYVVTGDSGNGLTHGTLGAMLLTDLIAGRSNAWKAVYDPARKSLRAAAEFGRENLNVAGHYFDWLKPGDLESTRTLPRGQGAVLRRGLRKVAAYRAEDGALFEHSAVCPHLGCVVAWNAAERTWDCPCHGSRFDKYDGHPLNGPAVTPLGSPSDDGRSMPNRPPARRRRPAVPSGAATARRSMRRPQ